MNISMQVCLLKFKISNLQHSAFMRLERLIHVSIRFIAYIYIYENLKHFQHFDMFFCSIKLDAVICTSLCRLLGIWGGSLIYSKCRTRYSRSILRKHWSSFIIAKRFVSQVCVFSLNCVLFCGMIVSVVDCRQSSCSYSAESSCVEQRRNCTSVCYRVSVVCEGVTSQQYSIWEELTISHVQIYFVSGCAQIPGASSP